MRQKKYNKTSKKDFEQMLKEAICEDDSFAYEKKKRKKRREEKQRYNKDYDYDYDE